MSKRIWSHYFNIIFIMILVSSLASCSSKDNADSLAENAETITITDTSPEDASGEVVFKVIMNTVNMRKSPGMGGSVIEKLATNSKVKWLNEVSTVTAPVKLRGVRYNDPWLYVKSDADNTGWIYAATVQIATNNLTSETLKQELLKRRVESFFGTGIATAINDYRAAYAQAKTSDSFANVYTYGLGLRDKMIQVLEKKALADTRALPDMLWLDELLPGYSHALVAEGTAFYLFADYNKLSDKAKLTQGNEDDQFVDLYLAMFPGGQESFFPSWIEQTTDYGGDSLLGRGVHKSILDKLDSLSTAAPVFLQIVNSIKHELLNDMTNPKTTFREDKDKRSKEVTAILDAGYSIFSSEDTASLKAISIK